jgi:N-acetyl sugar amidotransferase
MDDTDPNIEFDDFGVCNHCKKSQIARESNRAENSSELLVETINEIKENQKFAEFDGIVGISGGVDSSYLVDILTKFQLRLLLVHVDAGWNSSTATINIQRLVRKLGADLETVVIDWDSMRDLQIAYLRSGVLNQDVPQDHAFFATLYSYAKKHKIKYIFTGTNIATESIGVQAWGQYALDGRNLRAIHRKFGDKKRLKYPIYSIPRFYFDRYFLKRFNIIMPLNLITYSKTDALSELARKYNWEDYGGKHRESMFTSFYQEIYMYERFGIDKRIMHLSDLIMNGEMSRDQAVEILNEPPISAVERRNLLDYISSKLQITAQELEDFIHNPKKSYLDFKNDLWFLEFIEKTQGARSILKKFRFKK